MAEISGKVPITGGSTVVAENEGDTNRRDAALNKIQHTGTLSAQLITRSAVKSPRPTGEVLARELFQSRANAEHDGGWFPPEPESLSATGLASSEIEGLILKVLYQRAEASGRFLSEQLRLQFRLIDPVLQAMKLDRLVTHRGAAPMNDYIYELTELGRERAKNLTGRCTYFGAVPVPLEDYIAAVSKQTLAHQRPTLEDLRRAFADIIVDRKMLFRLGPAINSGRGMFLYGAPGNGKTSIAERITRVFGPTIWIPRALYIEGEIMRLYDPGLHEELPLPTNEGLLDQRKFDSRWVRIRRPTIVVGGELTMEHLEVTVNNLTHVCEAPLQLKSNCGTLVIDDFGRQRMTTDQLLNRWIVPLEKRYDFLNMASGKRIQVPFDQLIVFSTNLEPRDLVDDAFLRRIPYKIEVTDPDEATFRKLLKHLAPKLDVTYSDAAVDYLLTKHYRAVGRPLRCCQPRDLLLQIHNLCRFADLPAEMTPETIDFAVENYFAVM